MLISFEKEKCLISSFADMFQLGRSLPAGFKHHLLTSTWVRQVSIDGLGWSFKLPTQKILIWQDFCWPPTIACLGHQPRQFACRLKPPATWRIAG